MKPLKVIITGDPVEDLRPEIDTVLVKDTGELYRGMGEDLPPVIIEDEKNKSYANYFMLMG